MKRQWLFMAVALAAVPVGCSSGTAVSAGCEKASREVQQAALAGRNPSGDVWATSLLACRSRAEWAQAMTDRHVYDSIEAARDGLSKLCASPNATAASTACTREA